MGKIIGEGITFDDVLLVPQYSEVTPNMIDLSTQLTKNIKLNIPLMSAGMDTVTEHRMAIAMARQGGIGIIHKNMSIEQQAEEVDKVKRSENGVITDPFYLHPDNTLADANDLMGKFRISGVPITDDNGKLVGIITNRDLKFEENFDRPISECMTSENLITAPVGITLDEAKKILAKARKEKLPIVDNDFKLRGLITIKDIEKQIKYPASAHDSQGRLLAGCDEAPGTFELFQGRKYKVYRGMGSIAAMENGSKDRYFQTGAKKLVPEGVEGRVAYKGLVEDTIFQLMGGLRSGMGYCGAPTIPVLQETGQFIKMSSAALRESHPHDIHITKEAPNYSVEDK